MTVNLFAVGMLTASMLSIPMHAQERCPGKDLIGTVRDSTSALIPDAAVTLDGGAQVSSGSDGRFRFPCVADGRHHLSVAVSGFAPEEMEISTPHSRDLVVSLVPSIETSVEVQADAPDEGTGGISGSTLSGDRLQTLADDPDDLLRELQQMAAAAGGNPSATTVSVDGFQDDSKLPPKSSIASVKVNPDLFSAEYRQPPFQGGRIEVYTKPGQPTYHGALFTTNSSQWMNSRDPFSLSRAAIGKQRYGFELNGPIRRQGSDFSLALEHRSIDDFAVVNAVTLDSSGNAGRTIANVETPQRLWIGTARMDWQLGPKNVFLASYSANVNHLSNVGVGGTSLAETGHESEQFQHTLRFSNVTTVSARLLHEARFSLDWRGESDTPSSTSPQLQVSGSFTRGGSELGPQHISDFRTEWDDDVIVSAKQHTVKAGLQFFTYRERRRLTTNFNGTYIFGGGTAPVLDGNNQETSQTETITGLEQYRRAILHLPGGTPTAYSSVTGNPQIDFNQVRLALYAQDDWKLRPNLTISLGFRYFLQNDPLVLNGATPRAGIAWSPDKKKTWNLHAHLGMFVGLYSAGEYADIRRQDGIARVTSTVYNPVYGDPTSGNPTRIFTARSFAPDFRNIQFSIAEVGVTKTLPHSWTIQASLIGGRIWNYARSLNINTPTSGSPTGPRPIAPNLNLLQAQNSGLGGGDVEVVNLSQSSLKWVQFSFGAVRNNIRDNSDDDVSFSPQSAYTDAGEYARRTGNGLWETFGNASFKLPWKVQLSSNYYGSGNRPYNITTGFDNNGDGNFNDRPQFAQAGQSGAIATQYGLLVSSGGYGTLRRNSGELPWSAHLDANLQRTISLSHKAKADHPQTLTANIRSSNLLNHTNVTNSGGVLGSPLFGVPYAADPGRRLEGGLRYNF